MLEESNFELADILRLDSYSIPEYSIECLRREKNSLEDTKEQKEKIFFICNNNKKISTDNEAQEIKQRENISQLNKYNEKNINFISNNSILNISTQDSRNQYRKDAHYKHFKVILGKYIKNKINELKNKCFPYYSKNNFSSPNYKYTGNPKEKDNFNFLHFTIKDILIYGKDNKKRNRQYNNEILIKFIEMNEYRALDKNVYDELISFLNDTLENIITHFYEDEVEYNKLKNNSKYIKFDICFKRETGISLLEKNGFIKALKKYNTKNNI